MEWLHLGKLAIACLFALPLNSFAQNVEGSDAQPMVRLGDSDSIITPKTEDKNKPTKYIPTEKDMKQTFFQGFSVSADLLNSGLYAFSSYGNLEAALRLNLLNTYFPVVEAGMGRCNKTDLNTKIHFSTNAPYFRIGIDYNVLKDKWQANKLFVGIRYGLSNYNYSIDGPPQTDPIWHETQNLTMKSLNATSHYGEVVFGCQVKIWSFIHMGWSVRYKQELHTTKSLYSHPYYIPGYGTTVNDNYWGATYNLTFDLNWGKKKPTLKNVVENAIQDIQQQKQQKENDVFEGDEPAEEEETMLDESK